MGHDRLFFQCRRTARVILACAVFVAIGVFALGCGPRVKSVTALPPGVTQQQAQAWDTAVANLDKIATSTAAIRQALTATHTDGAFPDAAYGHALTVLGQIDNAQLSAVKVLNQTPKNFTADTKTQVVNYTDSIAAALQDLTSTGATGIKNPTSLQTVNNLLAETTAAVNLILAL